MQVNALLDPYSSFTPELQTLEDQITELAAHIQAANYRLLELLCEFDLRGGWGGAGVRSCAHWLNWKCGIALGAAREKVRVAHALKALPKISEAFRTGMLSYSKVRAMTRVATPKNEDYLMMIANHGTAAHVERLVRLYRRVKRIEAFEREIERHRERKLTWYVDDDGCWVFHGRFTPEQGAVIEKAIEAAFDQNTNERPDVAAEDLPDRKPETYPARRADALERVANSYLAESLGEGSGGDRYMLHVHTDLDTLKADGEGAESELEGCACVSAETSRRMACDASVVRYLHDPQGEPLNIGRKSRTIPPAIRRALKRRDGGCRFPGCTGTRFLDAHHIHHWADGGETSLANLVLLCPFHHRLIHEGGFGVKVIAGEEIHFSRPNGELIPAVPPARFSGNVLSITDRNRELGIDITSRTLVPDWCGDQMDDEMAVDGMIALE